METYLSAIKVEASVMAAVEYSLASTIPRPDDAAALYSTTPTATTFAGQARADFGLTVSIGQFCQSRPISRLSTILDSFLILGSFC